MELRNNESAQFINSEIYIDVENLSNIHKRNVAQSGRLPSIKSA